MTKRQHAVYDFLKNFIGVQGYNPSYKEIADGIGVNSLATVHKHVMHLQQKGYISIAHNRTRSIHICSSQERKFVVPAKTLSDELLHKISEATHKRSIDPEAGQWQQFWAEVHQAMEELKAFRSAAERL